MENNGNPYTDDVVEFKIPKHQSAYIKVIGVGGGGGNAVNNMYAKGINGVDFILCNTDAKDLDKSPVPVKIQLGSGLGAGNVPSVAEKAAWEKEEEIRDALGNQTRMLFITAGMGGGTGTGAAPVVAEIAKKIDLDDDINKILVVAIVTMPFAFEGNKRMEQAKNGIKALRQHVDAILVINNDKLREYGNMSMRDAFLMADGILSSAAKGMAEIMTSTSYVHVDFKDVNSVMANSGVALMGYGTASGDNRAEDAINQAIESPLLNDNSLEGTQNVLLYIVEGSIPLTVDEISIITNILRQKSESDLQIIWGMSTDESMGESLYIVLVATGFKEKDVLGGAEESKVSLDVNKTTISQPDPASLLDISIAHKTTASTLKTTTVGPNDKVVALNIPGMPASSPASSGVVSEKHPYSMPETLERRMESVPASRESERMETLTLDEVDFVTAEGDDLSVDTKVLEVRSVEVSQPQQERNLNRKVSLLDEYLEKNKEIFQSVKDKYTTAEGLLSIEKEPAYKRYQQVEPQVPSQTPEQGDYIVKSDGTIAPNRYLHDTVD